MIVAGGNAPVMAIIEYLSGTECRMRSVNDFPIGQHVTFSAALHGAPTLALEGTIVANQQKGARRAYVVSLKTSAGQVDAINRAIEAARSRHAAHVLDVHTGNGLTRSSVRIPVDFDVSYAQSGLGARIAHATNISAGGILMDTKEQLPVGASIEIEIPLGSERAKVHGRVVAHQPMSPNYNIAFYEISDEARDTIARFISTQTA